MARNSARPIAQTSEKRQEWEFSDEMEPVSSFLVLCRVEDPVPAPDPTSSPETPSQGNILSVQEGIESSSPASRNHNFYELPLQPEQESDF